MGSMSRVRFLVIGAYNAGVGGSNHVTAHHVKRTSTGILQLPARRI